jgi:hypothetical protein
MCAEVSHRLVFWTSTPALIPAVKERTVGAKVVRSNGNCLDAQPLDNNKVKVLGAVSRVFKIPPCFCPLVSSLHVIR